MDKEFDLDELNEIFELLKLESNSDPSNTINSSGKKTGKNHFVEIVNGNCSEKAISSENQLQKSDLNNNIENDFMKIETDDISTLSENFSLHISLKEDTPLALTKEELEDESPLLHIKNEIEDEDYFNESESFSDFSSSDDENYTTLIARGPEKKKTKSHNRTVYERAVPVSPAALNIPNNRNRRNNSSSSQVRTNLPSRTIAHGQVELGGISGNFYANSPDSGYGSPLQPIASPSNVYRSAPVASPSSYAVSQLPPIASPSSHAVSQLPPIASPSSHAVSQLPPIAYPTSHVGFTSAPIASPHSFSPPVPIASPRAVSLSASINSPHAVSLLPPIAYPSSHADLPMPVSSSVPVAPLSSHLVLSSGPIASPSSHVSSAKLNTPSSSHLDSSTAPLLPFGYKNNEEGRQKLKLLLSYMEVEILLERKKLQQNSIIRDSNDKQVVKRYDSSDSMKTDIGENLTNEPISLEEVEDVLNNLLISDSTSNVISDNDWNDLLNDLHDSKMNPSTISCCKNPKFVSSKLPVTLYKTVNQVISGKQKISFQIKDNAKNALRNSEFFDVEKYIDELRKMLTKIKCQEKSNEKVKIIDYDEKEEYKNFYQTNLHSAVLESNVERVLCIVEVLKRYDLTFFDINTRDANKKTALDYAIKKNMSLIINYLKENHAVPSITLSS